MRVNAVNGDFYRLEQNGKRKRKSDDSIILTKCGIIGKIKSTFTCDGHSKCMLLRQEYELIDNNIYDCIKFLKKNENPTYKIIRLDKIGKKAVFMQYGDTIAFSTLPNNFERN